MCDTLACLVESKQQPLVGMTWDGTPSSLPTLTTSPQPFSNIIILTFQMQEMC